MCEFEIAAGQSGEGILSGSYSLTRCEPVSPLAACARERTPSRFLATRDAAYEDALTRLPKYVYNCSGAKRRMNAARPHPSRASAPSAARHPRAKVAAPPKNAHGTNGPRAVTGLDPGGEGCPRRRFPKRARGEDPRPSGARERTWGLRPSERSAEEDTPRRPRAMH